MEFFPLVYCFLQGNYVQSWILPAFAVFSLWAQNVNHQPAVTYDMAMGKRDFVIKRNKINTSAAMHTFFVVQLFFFLMSGVQPFQFGPTYPPNEESAESESESGRKIEGGQIFVEF